jgi:tetratricopeptide (TPR) repeat protein
VRAVLALGAIVLLLTGCATTPRKRGDSALAAGNYAAAIENYRAALAENPDNLEALQGLGVAQYRAGALADAGSTLDAVLARVPDSRAALLYSGLAALQRGDDAAAGERLTRLRLVEPDPRFGAQVERAMRALRAGAPVTEDLRAFIAASLEDAARAVSEVRAARLEAQRAYLVRSVPGPLLPDAPRRRGVFLTD